MIFTAIKIEIGDFYVVLQLHSAKSARHIAQ